MVVAFSQTQHVPGERHEWWGCVRRSKALNLSELQFFLFLFLKSLLFKTKSCYVTWSGLTFSAFLPQSGLGWQACTMASSLKSLHQGNGDKMATAEGIWETQKNPEGESGCTEQMLMRNAAFFPPSFLGSCFRGKQQSSDSATPQPSAWDFTQPALPASSWELGIIPTEDDFDLIIFTIDVSQKVYVNQKS